MKRGGRAGAVAASDRPPQRPKKGSFASVRKASPACPPPHGCRLPRRGPRLHLEALDDPARSRATQQARQEESPMLGVPGRFPQLFELKTLSGLGSHAETLASADRVFWGGASCSECSPLSSSLRHNADDKGDERRGRGEVGRVSPLPGFSPPRCVLVLRTEKTVKVHFAQHL